MLLFSRLPQIYKNYTDKSTGQLSLITTLLTSAGSLIRIFTTVMDIGYDWSLIINAFIGGATSGIIFLQVN